MSLALPSFVVAVAAGSALAAVGRMELVAVACPEIPQRRVELLFLFGFLVQCVAISPSNDQNPT